MITTPMGAGNIRAPGQGQVGAHLQASQAAHAAAQRAAVARVLSRPKSQAPGLPPPSAPNPNSYKTHVLTMAGLPPAAGVHPVHAAIDAATQAGHFTPDQGAELKAHDGPLMGPPGAKTIATLGTILQRMKG